MRFHAFFIGISRGNVELSGMPRVLLVEDEPAIADTLVYALETECFTVTHALTGSDALAAAARETHDFAILDIGLPDMTGLDVCRRLRETSAIPVLFLTARNAEVDRILGLELGGDDYVTKPFSPREIVARVRAILRRSGPVKQTFLSAPSLSPPFSSSPPLSSPSSPSAPASLSAPAMTGMPGAPSPTAGFYHDSSAMRIHFNGATLDLTAHEYKLLLVLMARPGRVFSRDQLLDHAWQDPGAVTDRTVDAHIKSIRAKLRAASAGAENLIETRRGLGYSLASVA